MDLNKGILSRLAGTSAMTMFSSLASDYRKENLKLPELLGALLKDALPKSQQHWCKLAGWLTHYSIGVNWAFVYQYVYQKTKTEPHFKNGLILGLVSGLTGIALWRLFFKMHPKPPYTPMKAFLIQLLLAHIVYSMVVTYTSPKHKEL